MRHDLLSDMFHIINNADKIGRKECTVPASKLIKSILTAMSSYGYIGGFEFISDGKSGEFKIELVGKINICKSVKPRHAVNKSEYEKWESRYLPAKNFGILIISTSQGVVNQNEGRKKGIGGRILGYVY